MPKINKYAFYKIDMDYLEYLKTADDQVRYHEKYRNSLKPYMGIITFLNDKSYFIPITSAKEKHKKLRNVANEHILIYELVDNKIISKLDNGIYKPYSNDKNIHILALLNIKKMIPVPNDKYSILDFNEIDDIKYKQLFEKEFEFCKKNKSKILNKANKVYNKQMQSGEVHKHYCDFKKLEQAMNDYVNKDKK